ncbi:MAG: hypothetical protein ACFE0Q_02210 [Anaerolineae bacterium]
MPHVKFRGALTFDEDDALENALTRVEQIIQSTENSLLTMEQIEPLGLHLTVTYNGNATAEQVTHSRGLLNTLAGLAYSGYVDLMVDENDPERFHAKEIAPKEVKIEDIIN